MGLHLLSYFVASMLFLFGLNIIDILREGPRALVYGGIMVLAISFWVSYLIKRTLGDLYDHEMSHWKMEVDQVRGYMWDRGTWGSTYVSDPTYSHEDIVRMWPVLVAAVRKHGMGTGRAGEELMERGD